MPDTSPVTICGKLYTYDATTNRYHAVQTPGDHNSASRDADVELSVSSQPLETGEGQAFDSQVSLDVIHYRTRLADPDGLSVKAAIDGLVARGILSDDSAKEISEVRHRQVKVKTTEEEKTVFVITEV